MGTEERLSAEAVFSVVPEWVIDHPDITDKALRLYCVLARYTDSDRTAFPSRLTLANRMGRCNRSTVDRALEVLEAIGAVKVQRRLDPANPQKHLTSLYTLQVAARLRVAAPAQPPSRVGAARGSRVGAAQNENHLEREPLNELAAKKPRSPAQRELDGLMESLIEACQYERTSITDPMWGNLRTAAATLRTVKAQPADVGQRAIHYRLNHPEWELTPTSLAKWWADSATAKPSTRNAAKQVGAALERRNWRNGS